ncbi:MAG: hypothetical protein JW914_02140 [Syntrophaceae bacterium]|nr:hypothetical protein [Syntrophaceae bacterium]
MNKRRANKKNIKHQHGTPNPIIQREEEIMLSLVDKALASTSNSQTIGRNGEFPLRDFFNRYLPNTLRAATGHFVSPSGSLSPQIDVMILDSRYPLLAENADGSVLAMLHSVIQTVEVKTRISARDIEKMWKDSFEIVQLASEIDGYGHKDWRSIHITAFAFRSAQRLDTLEKKYEEVGKPFKSSLDITILRLPDRDIKKEIGVELHFEPDFSSETSKKVIGFLPITKASFTPLSDLYYRTIQDSYYTMETREYSFGDIAHHIMEYMSWATASWDEVFKE